MTRPPWESGEDGRREPERDDDPGIPSDRVPEEVDAGDLEQGDRVLIYQDGDRQATGSVVEVRTEAGRYGVEVEGDFPGRADDTVVCWQQYGRTFYRLEADR